jgi:hypothetical protein
VNPTKLKCVPFEWAEAAAMGVTAVPVGHPDGGDICYPPEKGANSQRPREQDLANMHFIAEAFSVYHETGLRPRELLEVWHMYEGLKE